VYETCFAAVRKSTIRVGVSIGLGLKEYGNVEMEEDLGFHQVFLE